VTKEIREGTVLKFKNDAWIESYVSSELHKLWNDQITLSFMVKGK
jgi:hypothetical protein